MNRKLMILSSLPILLIVAMIVHYMVKSSKDLTPAQKNIQQTSPAGLPELKTFSTFLDTFNTDSGKIRIISLLSPADPVSERGFHAMRYVLREIPDKRLRLFVIWIPVLRNDRKEIAEEKAKTTGDFRMVHFWDPNRITAVTWQETLGLNQLAWNVYLVYGDTITWDFEISPPTFWMRQLSADVEAPILEKRVFVEKIKELLVQIPLSTGKAADTSAAGI